MTQPHDVDAGRRGDRLDVVQTLDRFDLRDRQGAGGGLGHGLRWRRHAVIVVRDTEPGAAAAGGWVVGCGLKTPLICIDILLVPGWVVPSFDSDR
jgi:hypothetical protein